MQYSSYNFKLNGAQHLKDNVTDLHLIKDPIKAETYAQHLAKSIATATLTTTDVNIVANGDDLQMTINAKSGLDNSDVAAINEDLVVAYVDSVAEEVILVLDVTDRVLTNEAGDTVDIPAGVFYGREATSV